MYLVTSTSKDSLFVQQRRYEHPYILYGIPTDEGGSSGYLDSSVGMLYID